jgi:tetratricopeptide (TPR) repeat protein
VYDNVDDPHLNILPLIPQGTGCVIVITSRNHSIGQLSPEAHLELDVMSMDEAIELLMYSSDPSIQSEEQAREEARAVAEELGCLPIALAQARSYMFQTRCSADAYLKRIIVYRDRLLTRPVQHKEGMRYTSTYAAFEASFNILPERDQKLLWLFSFYHWAGVPLELVTLAAKHGFSSYEREYMETGENFRIGKEILHEIFYENGQFDLLNLDEMMINLQNSSLATLMPGIGTNLFRMHPLAHGWVHSSIPDQQRAKYQAAAVLLLALGARNDYTPSGQYLASHVNHLSRIWNQLHVNDAGAFGYILGDAGLSNAALQLQETVVVELRKQSHASLPDSLWLLGLNYRSMGRSGEANEVLEELLQLRKNAAKDASPEDFAAFKKVVIVYNSLGRHADSAELQAEMLKTRRAVMGEEHADTINAKNSLGVTYRYLGRLDEAERLNMEVLKWRQKALGARHPATVTSTYQLSYTYRSMGRFEEAVGLQREVLTLRKELLGERHPNTISAADTLARTYTEMGRHEDAEELRLRVLKLSKEVLGEHHYDTIDAMLYLAETYEKLSKKEEALSLLRPAESMLFETLGESHPLYKRLQEIMSQVQGPGGGDSLSSPDVISSAASFIEGESPLVTPVAPAGPPSTEEASRTSYLGAVPRVIEYES